MLKTGDKVWIIETVRGKPEVYEGSVNNANPNGCSIKTTAGHLSRAAEDVFSLESAAWDTLRESALRERDHLEYQCRNINTQLEMYEAAKELAERHEKNQSRKKK